MKFYKILYASFILYAEETNFARVVRNARVYILILYAATVRIHFQILAQLKFNSFESEP